MSIVRLIVLVLAASMFAHAKPHIVVFLADDHGYLDSQVYGNDEVLTPNMLRLAGAGMTFTRAFVVSPSCAPSRAALLTGLMPARNGAEANHTKPRAELKKLPAYLRDLGYEVVAFGKVSHYRHTADYGFDHFAHDAFHEHQAIPAALKWLRERPGDKPLCLFVGSNWPHVPWPEQPEAEAKTLPPTQVATAETRRARARYYEAVARMDAELGQVYDAALEKLGTNLLFLHTSDHGAQFPFGKWNCYDAGIRTSLLVAWPGVIKPASRTDAMVSWVDILPTLIAAAGGTPPAELDGRSFLPVLKGRKSSHRDRIFATHSADGKMNIYPMRCIRTADWKFILNLHPEFKFTTHIDLTEGPAYWDSWTHTAETNQAAAGVLKRYHGRPAEELYDLKADPHEQRNLAADPTQAARVKALRAELEVWMRDQGDRRRVFGKPQPANQR